MVESAAFRMQVVGRQVRIEHPVFGVVEFEASEAAAANLAAMDAEQLAEVAREMEVGIWEHAREDEAERVREILWGNGSPPPRGIIQA